MEGFLRDNDSMTIDEEALYSYIGIKIKNYRQKLGMSQARLAEAVGILRTSIANIESGNQRAPLHLLYKICFALDLEITEILPGKVEILQLPSIEIDLNGKKKQVPVRTAEFIKQLLEE